MKRCDGNDCIPGLDVSVSRSCIAAVVGLVQLSAVLRPQRPQGLLGTDGETRIATLDFDTAPELCWSGSSSSVLLYVHRDHKDC